MWTGRTIFWLENLKEKELEDVSEDGNMILQRILRKQGGKMWIGCNWPRIGTSGDTL